MKLLITWGSKMGGTEGIARILGGALQRDGVDVTLLPAGEAGSVGRFDAVVVGGAVYANRWHRDARRFVARNQATLRRVPVWFFSSGPLDDSADQGALGPPRQVEALMERVGALGHVTFGGRLAPDAKGFPASAMAKDHSGDWRNPERIQAWAAQLARTLPAARPGPVVAQPARAVGRLVAHGIAGWAACAAIMATVLAATSTGAAVVVHAVAVPFVFLAVAHHYFRPRGARAPLAAALVFAGIVALLDLIGFRGVAGLWLPLVLSFTVTWATGAVMSTLPWPKPVHPAPKLR